MTALLGDRRPKSAEKLVPILQKVRIRQTNVKRLFWRGSFILLELKMRTQGEALFN